MRDFSRLKIGDKIRLRIRETDCEAYLGIEKPPESIESPPRDLGITAHEEESGAPTAHSQGPESPLTSWRGIKAGMRLKSLTTWESKEINREDVVTVCEVIYNKPSIKVNHEYRLLSAPHKWSLVPNQEKPIGSCDCGGNNLRHQEHAMWCSSRR